MKNLLQFWSPLHLVFISLFIFLNGIVYTQTVMLSSVKQMCALFARYDYIFLVIVPREISKKERYGSLKRIIQTMNRLSERSDFELARLAFAKVDATDDVINYLRRYECDLSSVDIAYGLIFANQVLATDGHERAIFKDPQGYVQIEAFIQRFIGEDIEKIVEQYQKDRQLKRERARDDRENGMSSSVNIYYGTPFYRPYYYWDWPWMGPRYGGWYGGGWHYGRHHHHHHHGRHR